MKGPHVVALAADTLLYAPLFIAQEAGFFGSLNVTFGTIRRDSRKAAEGKFLHQELLLLWSVFSQYQSPPLLTVCDPMHALLLDKLWPDRKISPVLVGALIVRPACWVFDEASNMNDVFSRLRSGKMTKIVTHAPGMTAHTLTRWILRKLGKFEGEHIDNMVKPVQAPGEELGEFIDFREPLPYAAVSVDLLTMRRLTNTFPGKLGVCHDFGRDKNIPKYLMTGILTEGKLLDGDAERRSAVQAILYGISLALQLLRTDWRAAVHFLQQHYRKRTLGQVNLATKHSYLDHLKPVRIENLDNNLEEVVHDLSISNCYPSSSTDLDFSGYLSSTWDIYREANQGLLSDVELSFEDPDKFQDPSFGKNGKALRKFLTDTCLGYARRLCGSAPHFEVERIVLWLEAMKEKSAVQVSDFRVVGKFLCADEARRKNLLADVELIRRKLSAAGSGGAPCAVGVFGPPGSGKDTFVENIIDDLVRGNLLNKGTSVNLFKDFGSLEDIPSGLASALSIVEESDGAQLTSIFVNEFDKKGEAAYGKFSPFILPDYKSLPDGITFERLKKCAWFFAGTILGDRTTVFETLRSARPGGADFASRLGGDSIFVLPKLTDPLEQVLRFISTACTNLDGSVRSDRPLAIELHLLLWYAVQSIEDARDINRKMEDSRARMLNRKDNVLRQLDVMSANESRDFYSVYAGHIERLGRQEVMIEWDI